MERPNALLFLSLLVFLFSNHASGAATPLPKGVRFKLIHRHSPELGEDPGTTLGPPSSRRERMQQLVHSDKARLHTISQRLGPRRKNIEERTMATIKYLTAEMPMRSAADFGTGQYFVSFRIGAPPKKFLMIADTGSSLTWMKCKYKCSNCSEFSPQERVFYAGESSTFKPIPCSSDVCRVDLARSFSLDHCPIPTTPCSYDYRYADGTKVVGVFGNDTVEIRLSGGRKIKMTDVVMGCSERIWGRFQDIDGILGLGFDVHSFAVKAAQQFGHKFSYCLVDHLSPSNLVNSLVFGSLTRTPTPSMQHTQLILGEFDTYYGVNVSGISVNGTMLDIPPSVWDLHVKDGGVIVDSGSSLTYLVKPAFEQVLAAFETPLSRYKRQPVDPEPGPKFCFSNEGFEESMIPQLAIHFADGAKLVPPVKSYIIDNSDVEKCLGFASLSQGPSVIGNIMQQNHLWEFDFRSGLLGFAPSSCIFN